MKNQESTNNYNSNLSNCLQLDQDQIIPNEIPNEIWKPVYDEALSPYYLVSDHGRIYSLRKHQLIKPYTHKDGYLQVDLQIKKNRKKLKIHRLVLLSFNPIESSETLQVNHQNCIKTDNRLSNLQWCTQQENIKHAIENGRVASKNLKPEIVKAIKKADGKYKEIAEKFGVPLRKVADIKSGRKWKKIS